MRLAVRRFFVPIEQRVSFIRRESGDLGVVVERQIVPAPGQFKGARNAGRVPTRLIRRPFPILCRDNSLALAERWGAAHVRYHTAPKSFFA